MIKFKVEKNLIISFIGLIIITLVGIGGNLVSKAESPASTAKSEVNFDKRLRSLEEDLVAGNISKHEFDSLSGLLRLQLERSAALKDDSRNPDKIPEWVTKLGISEPFGMKFDQVFSNYTSVDDPTEGFNSVSLVYSGTYEKAMEEAARIASGAKLTIGGLFKAQGSPNTSPVAGNNSGIRYVNYSLNHSNQDFLVSVQVEPSGLLTIMATDNKQLNACLSAYGPLNNRQKSNLKQKKQ